MMLEGVRGKPSDGTGVALQGLIIAVGEKEGREVLHALEGGGNCVFKVKAVSEEALSSPESFEADVVIFVLPEGFAPHTEREERPVANATGVSLFLVADQWDKLRQWAFRNGAADVIVRPFLAVELQFRIERLVQQAPRCSEVLLTEPFMLEFLKKLLEHDIRTLEPALDPMNGAGYFYPDVVRHVGRTPTDVLLMDRLASEGVVTPHVVNRVKMCIVCRNPRINLRGVCPACLSADVARGQVVRHQACGHTGSWESFRKANGLVCPQCAVFIERPQEELDRCAGQLLCRGCGLIFVDPKLQAQCLNCGAVTEPEKIPEKAVYRYELTPLAEEAVREEQIVGLSLASMLRDKHTGFYNRSFFEHELDRDVYRWKRYNEPFSLLMVRIVDFEHLRMEHAAETEEYVNSVFKALGGKMRLLDTTCVWGTDILAVLLSGTNKEGAQGVARRMNENVAALDYLRAIHEPSVAIGIVSSCDGHKTAREVLEAGLRDLKK